MNEGWDSDDGTSFDDKTVRGKGNGGGFDNRARNNGGQRGWRGSRGCGRGNINSTNSNRTVITVRTSGLGKVIGRGGAKIRELQEASGATIKVINNYCAQL